MCNYFVSAVYEKGSFVVIITFVLITIFLTNLRLSNIETRRKLIRDFDDYGDNHTYDEYVEVKLKDMKTKVESIMHKKKMIKLLNEKQMIYNKEYFIQLKKGFVIVIQVYQDIGLLKELIESLRNVVGINKCLLIFSHGFYDSEINSAVMNITFAKYMQIYYPYSCQLYLGIFPGNDKKYCKDGYTCEQSNGERKPHLIQKKHHWWWQMNHVFDRIDVLQTFNEYILFLEEGQLVASDIVYMLTIVQRLVWGNPEFDVIDFGAYTPNISMYRLKNKFAKTKTWTLKLDNRGIAFNRTVWNIFKSVTNDFCNFNDYRWTNSLLHAASKTAKGKIILLAIEGPRVFKIEENCETVTAESCRDMAIQNVKLFLKSIKRGLFPLNVDILIADNGPDVIEEGGGFSDIRDREFCKLFSKETNSLTL